MQRILWVVTPNHIIFWHRGEGWFQRQGHSYNVFHGVAAGDSDSNEVYGH